MSGTQKQNNWTIQDMCKNNTTLAAQTGRVLRDRLEKELTNKQTNKMVPLAAG
jgi:hypothetical protein